MPTAGKIPPSAVPRAHLPQAAAPEPPAPPSQRTRGRTREGGVLRPDRWQRSLARAVRDPAELLQRLKLPADLLHAARRASELFPLMVPESFLQRMRPGDAGDPLLRQVLPLDAECDDRSAAAIDAVGDTRARKAPGLLHKYHGRALLIAAGACAVHCRYCFRRHYPYGEEPRRLQEWQPALDALAADDSLTEVILSGGDPLMLTDARLGQLIERLAAIPHLRRLRIHSRLPIVLPDRVTGQLLDLLRRHERLQTIVVVHANHPREIAGDCATALRRLVAAGIPTLNQSVLLGGINDDAHVLGELSERLVNLGVMPYYLHQLDRVRGALHFEVEDERARRLLTELRTRLPGYAVPQLVREIPGSDSKTPLG